MSGWGVFEKDMPSDFIHVVPLNDTHEHLLEGANCKCEPVIEIEDDAYIVIHNAYDFREVREWIENGGVCE